MYCLALSVLALAGLAAGSGYVSGREYVYRYRVQVSAGFPDRKPQYSGLVFQGNLHIQPKGEYAVFHITDKKYDAFNGDTTQKEKQPYRYDDLPPVEKYASEPFKVYFKDGQVTQFQMCKDEPMFSVNVKRALISLFHLTYDPAEPQNLSDRENEVYKPDYGEHYYKTMEDGVLGQCETQYVIEHLPYYKNLENNIVLNITKTRNYHKCNSMPNHYYSTFYGHECGHAEHEKAHTIHGNAIYHYDIRGDRHHYVIEKVTAEGDFGYTPYPLEGQTAEIFTNRTLELIEEKDSISEEFHVSGDLTTYHSLEHEFNYKPKFRDQVDLKKPHYLYHVYGKKVPLEQIRELVTKLIHIYDDETYHKAASTKDKDYSSEFMELVKSVGTLGYDEIAELHHEFCEFTQEEFTPDKLLKKSLFFDVLVNVGTNPALLFAKTLVKTGKVPEPLVLNFLQQMPYSVKEVTQTLLDEAYALCKDDYMVARPKLYIACYLSLANIIHDKCVARYHPERNFPGDEYSCPDDVPVSFFQEISQKYRDSEDENRKIAYITALGRLGVKDSLQYLSHYVVGDAHQSLFDRVNAIYALGTIARRHPELVRELIIPLYYNTTESYEVRIAAFNMIIGTHPELYELETIARNLIDETDDQVRSYVYSAFRSYDNSTYPCDLELAHDVRYALSILKPHRSSFDKYDHSYSHQHYTSGYNSDYGYGDSTKFSYVASDTGYIPRSMYLRFNGFLGGKSFNTFAIGFKQHGLEKFTDKIFGPDGTYWKKSLFDLFKKRTARGINDADKYREEIKEKLHLPTKEYEHMDGEIFFKYMGNKFSFLYFNETTFESFFTDGAFEIPDLPAMFKQIPPFRYQKFRMLFDLMYVIPSESGFPIAMDFKHAGYFYYKNDNLKLEANPAFFKEDRPDQPPTNVHAKVEGHFIFDNQYIGSVGIVQQFEHQAIGAGVERRCTTSLPINLDIGINLKEHNLNIQWKPVVPHQIYHSETEPFTFIDSYDDNLAVVEEKEYHPIRRMGYQKQTSKEFKLVPFGLKVNIDQNYDNEWHDSGSFFTFIVRKSFVNKFFQLLTNPGFEPYQINVTLDNMNGETITEVNSKFSFSFSRNEVTPKPNYADTHFEEFGQSRTNNMITGVFQGEIAAHGTKDRKVQGEIIYSSDIYDKYRKLSIYYDRTPFFKGETDHLKVCMSGYLKYSEPNEDKIAVLEVFDLDRHVDTGVKAHFGKDCSTDQKITIHGHFSKTDEELEMERHREEPEHPENYNPHPHLYQTCLNDRSKEVLFPKSCSNYLRQLFKLHKYSFDIKYEHLSPRFLNMTQKIDEFLRHELYDHSDTDYIHGPEGETHVEFNVSAVYPVADIRVRTPSRKSHYTHVYVPHFSPFHIFPQYEDILIKKTLTKIQCKMIVNIVDTFDRYNYHLPSTDCWKVVSKDCSPSQSFIVLGRKTNHPEHLEETKIIFGKHIVEMFPVTGSSKIVIRVDGKEIPVSGTEHYYHHEEGSTDSLFDVGYKEDIDYTLQSEQYGLIVEYDGCQIAVELSPYYKGKLCGLCGNYNGQQNDIYVNENGCIINDDESYANSFAIPSETCSVPKIDSHCHTENGIGCYETATQILKLNEGKIPRTCFSIKPVLRCRQGCQARSHFIHSTPFHCLPANDDTTKRLLGEAKSRVLHEIRRKSHDHEASVQVDEGCHHE